MRQLTKKCKNLTNKSFGKLTVLKPSKDKNGNIKKSSNGCIIWECICECGETTGVSSGSLKPGHTKSCRKCNYEDLTDKLFGKLTAIKPAKNENGNIKKTSGRRIIWECKCECGKITKVSSGSLKSGHTKSCGKCNYDLTDKLFGKLTATKPAKNENSDIKKTNGGNIIWECICECGETTEVSSANLKPGNIKSCGKCNYKDLADKLFGKLIVTKPIKDENGDIKKTNNGYIIWECICECGKTTGVSSANLKSGNTKSCGCITCKKNVSQNLLAKIVGDILKTEHIEQDYRKIEWLRNPKTGYALEIDIYVPLLKLAIERDGKQHLVPVSYFGGEERFENQKFRDNVKNKLIKEHIKNGGADIKYFVRFNYKDKLTKENVLAKLKKIGVIL